MSWSSVHHPWWYSVSVALAFVYPFLAIRFASNAADTRIALFFPLIASLTAASFGAYEVTRGLAIVGLAPHSVAAGAAETLTTLAAGALSSVAISIFFVFRAPRLSRIRRTVFGLAVLVTAVSALAAYAVLLWRLAHEHVQYSPAYATSARVLALATTVLVLAAIGALFVSPRRVTDEGSTVNYLLTCAVVALAVFLSAYVPARRLWIFAMGS